MSQVAPPRRRVGRPRGETRERILDVALEMFVEQGYDATSLREIADRLGFTKAALYHHFARKEDILLALHLRLHDLGGGLLDRFAGFEDPQKAIALWPRLLDELMDAIVENRELILLHSRNHGALEQLESHEHEAGNEDVEGKIRQLLANPAIPLRQRVRLGFGLAAVVGTVMLGPDVFGADLEELIADLRLAVGELFA